MPHDDPPWPADTGDHPHVVAKVPTAGMYIFTVKQGATALVPSKIITRHTCLHDHLLLSQEDPLYSPSSIAHGGIMCSVSERLDATHT